MAFSRTDSFVEFKEDSLDSTRKALSLHSHANGEETQQNTEGTFNAEIISKHCTSLMKQETTAYVDFKEQGTEIDIHVSGFSAAKFGSDIKAWEVQSCKLCCTYCYSSSDEENKAVAFKIPEVKADCHAYVNIMIAPPVPVFQKRGCMNTSWYFRIIAELKEKQKTGNFDGHERLVEILIAKSRSAADFDMEMSVQIERARVLYFQKKFENTKRILKSVINHENKLKNPGILAGRALNFLTAVYKHQGKFGKAMECVERARACLESQDSAYDKAELHHSYGALIMAMPAAKNPETVQTTKEEAYKSYQMADNYEFRKYHQVKMAELLLKPRFSGERIVHFPREEELMKAKERLDFVESKLADSKSSRIRITYLLLRSDQHLYKGNVAMAMENVQEAIALIDELGFEVDRGAAKIRFDNLSTMIRQENEQWRETELSSSSSTSDHLNESESAPSD